MAEFWYFLQRLFGRPPTPPKRGQVVMRVAPPPGKRLNKIMSSLRKRYGMIYAIGASAGVHKWPGSSGKRTRSTMISEICVPGRDAEWITSLLRIEGCEVF